MPKRPKAMDEPPKRKVNRSVRWTDDDISRLNKFRIKRYMDGMDSRIMNESEAIRMLFDLGLKTQKL